ncbi:conserved hypothetical protein [Culex quinquefasciatus]|uniref:SAM domain-containing protein n=1 Tax=Culex quinquefasciatus TaxID=7176 RepID=B0WF30_CULQU|nr:conserved hypothetical protein [Culex quinquefasciatus]|eukprot:XP_001847314.1 conserved hypothetical protein [Culex quinquefasciatus]
MLVEKQPEEVPALLKIAMLKGIADTDSSTPVLKHDIYNDGMPLNTTEEIDGVPMQSSEEKLKTGSSFQVGNGSIESGFFCCAQQVEKHSEEEPDQQIEDEELHGVPLNGAVLLKCAMLKEMSDTDSRTPVLKREITIKSSRWSPSWVKFFTNAGIPSQAAAGYAHVFVENRFQMDMLMDLNYLREMGITTMWDFIAILCNSKTVCNHSGRETVLSSESAVVEGPVLLEHLANLVPVAAVSATLSNPPKSAVSPRRGLCQANRGKTFSSTKSHFRLAADLPRTLCASTVGSIGKWSAVVERLERNSNDEEEEDGEFDADIDDAGNGRKPPKNMAPKVTRISRRLGRRVTVSAAAAVQSFRGWARRATEKRKQSDEAPAGILKKSPNVIPVKKIPAKVVTAGDEQMLSSRRRSFDHMNSDGKAAKSVSFSKEDEVLEIESRPKDSLAPRPGCASMIGNSRFGHA